MTPDLLPQRIAARIAVDDSGCWLWTGALSDTGYGSVMYDRRIQSTHRLAYTLLVDGIGDGLVLDHLCEVRRCMNPQHLEPVTRAENNRRAQRKWAAECKAGHQRTAENTYINPVTGQRACRECARATHHRNKERRNAYCREWRRRREELAAT